MILTGRILIELNQSKPETKSGILLPPSMVMEKNLGIVLMSGKGKKHTPQEVEPGDMVVFNHKSFRNSEFEHEGKEVVLISQQDIYLIKKQSNGTESNDLQNG